MQHLCQLTHRDGIGGPLACQKRRPRASNAAAAAARDARRHFGTPGAAERGRLSAHGCSRRGSCQLPVPDQQPRATALVWLQAGQRRTRHESYPALSRAPLDRVYGALHGTGTGSVQGFLERLNESRRQCRQSRAWLGSDALELAVPPASIFRVAPLRGKHSRLIEGPRFRWGPTWGTTAFTSSRAPRHHRLLHTRWCYQSRG